MKYILTFFSGVWCGVVLVACLSYSASVVNLVNRAGNVGIIVNAQLEPFRNHIIYYNKSTGLMQDISCDDLRKMVTEVAKQEGKNE